MAAVAPIGGDEVLERFLIDVGDGEAVVSVKAKQNWDRHGWLVNGDFQSTNGTSSVADQSVGDLRSNAATYSGSRCSAPA